MSDVKDIIKNLEDYHIKVRTADKKKSDFYFLCGLNTANILYGLFEDIQKKRK